MTDVQRILFHPFATGALGMPGVGRRVLLLGAEPGLRLPDDFEAELFTVQGFRPSYNALLKAGFAVDPLPQGTGYDVAMVVAGRHRGRNEALLAEALQRTAADAAILVGGSKDDGIASLRKRLAGLVEIDGNLPKHHGAVFWFRRPGNAISLAEALGARTSADVEERFETAPGMFSFDRVDEGSRQLAGHFPDRFEGAVADFCSGWGYLSAEVLRRADGLTALDLYEADYESLEAAKRNVAARPPVETRFVWLDLLSEKPDRRYDAVVMNPPFHRGRAAEPEVGQTMIRAAAAALKPGGRLWMVANRQLPYEATLSASFQAWTAVAEAAGYKVIAARR